MSKFLVVMSVMLAVLKLANVIVISWLLVLLPSLIVLSWIVFLLGISILAMFKIKNEIDKM